MIATLRRPPYDSDFGDATLRAGGTGAVRANARTGRIRVQAAAAIPNATAFAYGTVVVGPLGPFPDATTLAASATIDFTCIWALATLLGHVKADAKLTLELYPVGLARISTSSHTIFARDIRTLAQASGRVRETRLLTTAITTLPTETYRIAVTASVIADAFPKPKTALTLAMTTLAAHVRTITWNPA